MGMHLFSPLCIIKRLIQQLFNCNVQCHAKNFQFNIGYKPLTAFNALNCIFINVHSQKL